MKRKSRIDEALRIVGLEDKANTVPSVLSSGMRRRASLAAGLIVTTPIFFLDEPTVGIDPITSHEIRGSVREKLNRERGQTIFPTTHIMDEAEIMCDHVAIMNEGRIVACDRPANLAKRAQSEEIIEIVALNMTAELVEKLRELETVHNVTMHVEDRFLGKVLLRFHVADAEESLPEIVHAMEKGRSDICYAKQVKSTLEDAFIQLTAKDVKQ